MNIAHVEIKCELAEKESTHDVHILITEYLTKELQEFIPTKYEHSYDAIEKVFRFDLSPKGNYHFGEWLFNSFLGSPLICFRFL